MLGQPSEPTTHSRTHEKGIGLLFILGAVVALVAVVYLLSFVD